MEILLGLSALLAGIACYKRSKEKYLSPAYLMWDIRAEIWLAVFYIGTCIYFF